MTMGAATLFRAEVLKGLMLMTAESKSKPHESSSIE